MDSSCRAVLRSRSIQSSNFDMIFDRSISGAVTCSQGCSIHNQHRIPAEAIFIGYLYKFQTLYQQMQWRCFRRIQQRRKANTSYPMSVNDMSQTTIAPTTRTQQRSSAISVRHQHSNTHHFPPDEHAISCPRRLREDFSPNCLQYHPTNAEGAQDLIKPT